ncbi:MAG: flagellar basal body L-ring protein FlgH [Polyangiaceae bacterium]
MKARAHRGTYAMAALLGSLLTACAPPHIGDYTPKHRNYHPGDYARRDPKNQPSRGSLFSEAIGGYLEDTRAVHLGDIVLIRIDEMADASGDSSTALTRDSHSDFGIPNILGLGAALKAAAPGVDLAHILETASSADFDGHGETSRKGELKGSIAVRVAGEMPNGDLFLEGTKVIMINNEEYHLYVSGVVRRTDIEDDNTVASMRIADAEIEFSGRGDIADQQRKGLLGRALDKANPF